MNIEQIRLSMRLESMIKAYPEQAEKLGISIAEEDTDFIEEKGDFENEEEQGRNIRDFKRKSFQE